MESFKAADEAKYNDFMAAVKRELPEDYDSELPVYEAGTKKATRGNSGDMIQELSKTIPTFFGGAADLAGSNKTNVKEASDFAKDNYADATLVWRQRICNGSCNNGMAAHGGVYPYAGTFFLQ
ncbi:hypothetical protein [Jeotgalicoccus sp. WY2]|uniref:hypothetical protein n=1 Tax=Jeotgalicoccus sp. WY2 TaxID=2708346 RepID=UPI0035300EB5